MGNRRTAVLPFCLTLFILFAAPAPGFGQADSARVKVELKKILEELKQDQQPQSLTQSESTLDFFQALGEFFKKYGTIIIIILIAVFSVLIVMVIRNMIPSFRRVKEPVNRNPDPEGLIPGAGKTPGDVHELYSQAVLSAQSGDYNRAVVLLHKASMAVLTDRSLIRGGDEYTNNEIRAILTERNPCYHAFSLIAQSSERIVFRYDSAGREEYERLLSAYDTQMTGKPV